MYKILHFYIYTNLANDFFPKPKNIEQDWLFFFLSLFPSFFFQTPSI